MLGVNRRSPLVLIPMYENFRLLGILLLVEGLDLHKKEITKGQQRLCIPKWLKERDVSVLGRDGVSERFPFGIEGISSPIHQLLLAGLGMPLLDSGEKMKRTE